jgi:hypothetical protein
MNKEKCQDFLKRKTCDHQGCNKLAVVKVWRTPTIAKIHNDWFALFCQEHFDDFPDFKGWKKRVVEQL